MHAFSMTLSTILIYDVINLNTLCNLVPRPYLSRGKGSGELGRNPRFSFYGARQLGHAKLGSDWSVWMHRRLAVEQSWDLIGLHYCMCGLAYTASTTMLHSCGKLVI